MFGWPRYWARRSPWRSFMRKILAHLADDFNTPRAVAALFDFVREANASARPGQRTAELLSEFNGLFDFLPSSVSLDPDLLSLIQQREHYRATREYGEADALREQLRARGVHLYDTPEGVRWRRIAGPTFNVPTPGLPSLPDEPQRPRTPGQPQ